MFNRLEWCSLMKQKDLLKVLFTPLTSATRLFCKMLHFAPVETKFRNLVLAEGFERSNLQASHFIWPVPNNNRGGEFSNLEEMLAHLEGEVAMACVPAVSTAVIPAHCGVRSAVRR